jgi:hypothetical protein
MVKKLTVDFKTNSDFILFKQYKEENNIDLVVFGPTSNFPFEYATLFSQNRFVGEVHLSNALKNSVRFYELIINNKGEEFEVSCQISLNFQGRNWLTHLGLSNISLH